MERQAGALPHVKHLQAEWWSDRVVLRVGEFDWPSETIVREDDAHMVTWMMGPLGSEPVARIAQGGGAPMQVRVGEISFRPAGSRLVARGDGAGPRPFLSCAINPVHTRAYPVLQEPPRHALAAGLRLDRARFEGYARRLLEEVVTPAFAQELVIDGVTSLLVIELVRLLRAAPAQVPQGGLAPWQLRRIREMVEESDGAAIRIAGLAAACQISPTHLKRAFRQSTGMTVHEYVSGRLAARAAALLAGSDRPVAAVARTLGFASVGGFAAAFARYHGQTPGAWRRRMRG